MEKFITEIVIVIESIEKRIEANHITPSTSIDILPGKIKTFFLNQGQSKDIKQFQKYTNLNG